MLIIMINNFSTSDYQQCKDMDFFLFPHREQSNFAVYAGIPEKSRDPKETVKLTGRRQR